MYRLKVRADPVHRESRLMAASVMYPITDERVGDLMDNEVRVSSSKSWFTVCNSKDKRIHAAT